MAKKKTLESFKNGCTFENYINITNYCLGNDSSLSRRDKLDKMKKITKNGLNFFKKYQEEHLKREKPGFFSKFFNTKYNRLYNEEKENLRLMEGDLYKLGVPYDILQEKHKVVREDEFKINNSVDDCLYGVDNGNDSLRANRWRDGLSLTIEENGKSTKIDPINISEFKEPEKEPVNLANDFEVVNYEEIVIEEHKDLVIDEPVINNDELKMN